MDTTALGVFLNLRLQGKDFRNKLTQYITMSVIPCSEGLILPNLIKSSIGRWWWYYFWTYSTTNKGVQIRTSNHCGNLVFLLIQLLKSQNSIPDRSLACRHKHLLLLQKTCKLMKREKSLTITFYQVSHNVCLQLRIHTCWQLSNML